MPRSIEKPHTPLAWSRWATELSRALAHKEWRVADGLWADAKGSLGPFLRNAAQSNNLPEAEWIVGKMVEQGDAPTSSFSLMSTARLTMPELWSASGRWSAYTESERRYGYESGAPGELSFSATDVAVFHGSEQVLTLLLRMFPQEMDSGRWTARGSVMLGSTSSRLPVRAGKMPRAIGGPGGAGGVVLSKVAAAVGWVNGVSAGAAAQNAHPRQDWKFAWEGSHWLGSLACVAAISPVLNADDAKAQAIFNRLERAGVDCWASAKNRSTPLALACLLGRTNTVLRLATSKGWMSGGGRTNPLSICARFNELDLVDWLLEAGENVDRSAKHEPPPVWIACASGNKEMTQKLIDAGARLDIAWDGESFADFAQKQGMALPRASMERSELETVMKDSEQRAKKKKKKAFAQEKRKLAEAQGVSVEEAGVLLRQQAEELALRKAQEVLENAPVARPRSRRL